MYQSVCDLYNFYLKFTYFVILQPLIFYSSSEPVFCRRSGLVDVLIRDIFDRVGNNVTVLNKRTENNRVPWPSEEYDR